MATRIFLRLEYARRAGFGPHRAALLEAIERYGSITVAATALGITYRRTWQSVQEVNDQFGEMIVVKRGRHGGGASITPAASELLKRYREVERRIYEIFAKEFEAMEKLVGEDPDSPMVVPRAQLADLRLGKETRVAVYPPKPQPQPRKRGKKS